MDFLRKTQSLSWPLFRSELMIPQDLNSFGFFSSSATAFNKENCVFERRFDEFLYEKITDRFEPTTHLNGMRLPCVLLSWMWGNFVLNCDFRRSEKANIFVNVLSIDNGNPINECSRKDNESFHAWKFESGRFVVGIWVLSVEKAY